MSYHERTRAAVMLAPVTTDDLPCLIELHTAAFRSDMFSSLMLLNRPDGTHQMLMKKSIDYWFMDPQTHLIKAVDTNGEVVGWACWVLKGSKESQASTIKNSNSSPALEQKQRLTEAKAKNEAKAMGSSSPKSAETLSLTSTTPSGVQDVQQQLATQDLARALGGLMREEMVSWEDQHLKDKEYMVLQALATSPSYQGRGIGAQLIEWGVERADDSGLSCWAHSSPAGHTLYLRAGFEELGRSDFNLAEWAPGGKEGCRGLGCIHLGICCDQRRILVKPGYKY